MPRLGLFYMMRGEHSTAFRHVRPCRPERNHCVRPPADWRSKRMNGLVRTPVEDRVDEAVGLRVLGVEEQVALDISLDPLDRLSRVLRQFLVEATTQIEDF